MLMYGGRYIVGRAVEQQSAMGFGFINNFMNSPRWDHNNVACCQGIGLAFDKITTATITKIIHLKVGMVMYPRRARLLVICNFKLKIRTDSIRNNPPFFKISINGLVKKIKKNAVSNQKIKGKYKNIDIV